jgi:hypothetical protein
MRYIYLRIGHKVHINMDIKKWDAGFTYHGVGVMHVYNGFLCNNQPDALINQIYSVIKLYMFRASSLLVIRNSVLYIRYW